MSDESCGLGTARWTCDESGGSVHRSQKPWMQSTSRAAGETCHSVRSDKVASKIGKILETLTSVCGKKKITISSGLCCSTVVVEEWFSHFLGNWNVLTTWPIQSVLTEAPFLCARKGKKGILTNCADVGPSLLENWLVSREVCQWNISSQQESVHTCDPPDVEEATAFPSDSRVETRTP